MIVINIDKAKEIKKDYLRADRKPLLENLDIQYMKAIEQGLETSEIIAEKQRLRDITNVVDTVETLDELKTITVEQGGV